MIQTNAFGMTIEELRNSRFSNNTGSSQLEIDVCVMLPVFFNSFAIILINMFFQIHKSNYHLKHFFLEFLGCIIPLVFTLTILSNFIYEIFFFLLIISIILVFIAKSYLLDSLKTSLQTARIKDHKLPCISHFRGVVNLYSVICILCADFNSFPSRFLKTEFYGYSLMDTGVGLYVVALSFASNPSSQSKRTIFSIFMKSGILLLLGFARYLSVRSTNYHHQIFEYGIHWNFFITLAILTIFNEFLFLILKSNRNLTIFSVSLLIIYEFALSAGLKDWIFEPFPRSTFISANKEGILSLAGYESLYLWGVVIKNFLPKSGDSFKSYIKSLSLYCRVLLIFFILNIITHKYLGVSRRCANCGYVFWITTISLICLCLLIVLELVIFAVNATSKVRINYSVPLIIDSINFNGLLFFLLGNLLTGLINLNINTLLISDFWSVAIIITYILICCSTTVFLYLKNWRIR